MNINEQHQCISCGGQANDERWVVCHSSVVLQKAESGEIVDLWRHAARLWPIYFCRSCLNGEYGTRLRRTMLNSLFVFLLATAAAPAFLYLVQSASTHRTSQAKSFEALEKDHPPNTNPVARGIMLGGLKSYKEGQSELVSLVLFVFFVISAVASPVSILVFIGAIWKRQRFQRRGILPEPEAIRIVQEWGNGLLKSPSHEVYPLPSCPSREKCIGLVSGSQPNPNKEEELSQQEREVRLKAIETGEMKLYSSFFVCGGWSCNKDEALESLSKEFESIEM